MLTLIGGIFFLMGLYVLVMYRVGGFQLTERERRTWPLLAAVLAVVAVLAAAVGSLPPAISLLLGAATLLLWVWEWRTGRHRVENLPTDVREEAERRRAWMDAHRGLAFGISAAFVVLILIWSAAVAIATRPS